MKDKDFGDRLSAAKDAKKAMLAKFRQRPGLDDPAVIQRQAERAAVSAARDLRKAERDAQAAAAAAEKVAQEEREAAEREAAAVEKAAQEKREAADKEAADAQLELDRKAARDARYAARKARK